MRVAYLGADYHGFAAQLNEKNVPINTVEHQLFQAMVKVCLIKDMDSCGYSRCGRTDMGVSALGQVVGVWFRSKQAKEKGNDDAASSKDVRPLLSPLDELNYAAMLNRVLPPTIRILGWSDVPDHFNARFSCSYRMYRYYFPKRMLDIGSMRKAGEKLLGLHDFRNFCKMDVVNVRNFERTLLRFAIRPVDGDASPDEKHSGPDTMYYFEFKGTAFLWHQVRMMVGVLFLVGAGRETPEIVDWLLDVKANSRQPHYDMASELPLVLYDCGFHETRFNYNLREAQDIANTLEGLWHRWAIQATLSKIFIGGLVESLKAICEAEGEEASARSASAVEAGADDMSTTFGTQGTLCTSAGRGSGCVNVPVEGAFPGIEPRVCDFRCIVGRKAAKNWVKLSQRQTAGSYEERVAALNGRRAAARAWHDDMRAKAAAGELGDAGNSKEAAIVGLKESMAVAATAKM